MRDRALVVMLFIFVCLSTSIGRAAGDDYQQLIKPILRARCYACHGVLRHEAGLRLDTASLAIKGGDSGPAIVPGDVTTSLLLKRVTAADDSERMPPEGEPLAAEQIAVLEKWISDNAEVPSDEQAELDPRAHWAFRARVRPTVPEVSNTEWVRNPIDAFLAWQHEANGLTPQPEASRAVLLRRLHIDLIGLPPTLAEITEFEDDASPDWYENAVSRLLDDPRHGERWGRHWMDIWRYSDWWGLGAELRNSQKHIWHWRDWIIESLNDDLPYDEMVRQMLAADELYPNDMQKLRATGFLARNWFLFSRLQWMDETVEHVSKGLLGITMNCAKCHDHKYDPITHVDYYRMRAFFEPYHVRMDMVPNEIDLALDGIPRVFDGLLDEPTYLFVRGDETRPDKSTVIAPGVPELLAFKPLDIRSVSLPKEAWQPERRRWVLDAWLAEAQEKVESALAVDAKTAAVAAQSDLNVIELALAEAKAELSSLESRIAAMQATWARTDAGEHATNAAMADDEREKINAAIQSEREVAVARARHAVAKLDLRLAAAADDKKDAIHKELETARELLKSVTEAGSATVLETDTFTPLEGAKWTTTRFVHPNRDDAPVTFPGSSTGRRTALADWITDPQNPLTARVAVNHLWARHMGAPLVSNLFELGRRSEAPGNPELIDWLASELVENGWSMKHLHRLIVTSAAYRMSSSEKEEEKAGNAGNTEHEISTTSSTLRVPLSPNVLQDPDNRYWWRRTAIRIESEVMRDSLLALAGELDLTIGGPPVPTGSQADSKRRSLYFFHSNNDRNMFLTTFDEADVKECYRRDQSIVPQQALALSNSRLVLDCAEKIAAHFGAGIPLNDDVAFVRQSFRGVLCVPPTEPELSACVRTLKAWRKLPAATPEEARRHLIWVLINHNDFVTVR